MVMVLSGHILQKVVKLPFSKSVIEDLGPNGGGQFFTI